MIEVPGYTEAGLVGFTDRGLYNATETYYINDLVSRKNTIWKCLADNVVGVEPSTDATKWSVFIRGPLDAGDLPITSTEYNEDLNENTWKQISDASRSGIASTLWNVGDVKMLHIKGENETYSFGMRIAGFNHDDLATGNGKAGITFVSASVLASQMKYGVAQGDGGYLQSNLKTLFNDYSDQLPGGLWELLRTVKKKVLIYGTDEEPEEFECKMFSPSVSEMFSHETVWTGSPLSYIPNAWKGEGAAYALFNNNTIDDITGNRKSLRPYGFASPSGIAYKLASTATNSTMTTWLRTPSKYNTNSYTKLYQYGSASMTNVITYDTSTIANYVMFCFCL